MAIEPLTLQDEASTLVICDLYQEFFMRLDAKIKFYQVVI